MTVTNKTQLLESLQSSEDALHGFSIFLIGIGIAFLFLMLSRLMLGIMTCVDLIFSDSAKKASKKVEKAKKRGATKKGGKKKKKKHSASSKSTTSKSSKRGGSAKSGAKKEKNDLKKQRFPSISPKPKAAKSNVESSRTDSSKKDGTNSNSERKFKRWIVEKRKNNTTKSSNSSTINATSIDLLATPKINTSQLPTALPPPISATTKSVTFDNVPEPATNTAYKYARVATSWPAAIPQDPVPKLFKSDDCPTPNPFKDPAFNIPIATTPRNNLETAIVEIPKSVDDMKKNDNFAFVPKSPSKEYMIYAPHEVPSEFATENVRTALEYSNISPAKKGLRTPTKRPSQTIIPIPFSPALSIQSTPQATSDTQNSVTLQSPVPKTVEEKAVQSTPQATSDTQNSLTLQSPVPKTAEEKKL